MANVTLSFTVPVEVALRVLNLLSDGSVPVEKPKRARKSRAKKAAPAPEPEPMPEPEVEKDLFGESVEPGQGAAPTPTLDDIRMVAQDLVRAGKIPEAKAPLKAIGVETLVDLDPALYQQVYDVLVKVRG